MIFNFVFAASFVRLKIIYYLASSDDTNYLNWCEGEWWKKNKFLFRNNRSVIKIVTAVEDSFDVEIHEHNCKLQKLLVGEYSF
jgi:hypothetical protein